METKDIINRLWKDYSSNNPSVQKIYDLFNNEGEVIQNDHIALRTFNDKRINIDVLARIFLNKGYKQQKEYFFPEKKLFAKHFENPEDETAPKILISELLLEKFSLYLQNTIRALIDRIPVRVLKSDDLVYMGNMWELPSYDIYQKFLSESDYAAWLYVFGFRANHFTVSANSLKKYSKLEDLNLFLKNHGFVLNTLGGEIKGKPEELLEQSSIMADMIKVKFKEGTYEIPSCHYGFAKRYINGNGKLFSGIIAKSTVEIFESTNLYKKVG